MVPFLTPHGCLVSSHSITDPSFLCDVILLVLALCLFVATLRILLCARGEIRRFNSLSITLVEITITTLVALHLDGEYPPPNLGELGWHRQSSAYGCTLSSEMYLPGMCVRAEE